MRTIHRTTTPKLQNAARVAAMTIRDAVGLLRSEIERTSIDIPPKQKTMSFGPKKLKPETVTYKTDDIESLILNIVERAIELDWWSSSVEERSKLAKPHSLK